MASFWRKKSEPSSTWSVGTNLSIGSTHQTMKNVNTLVIRLYRNNATDPELWMVLMQPDQQVAIDLNCSNADDGTVSLSIGAAVACRPIAKLNFVFDWSRESYRKCNCTQLVIPRIKAQLATPPVPCPISRARRRSSRHHSWWRCGTVTERQRIHAWCPSIGSMHEIMKTVLTSAAIILSQNNIVVEFVLLLQQVAINLIFAVETIAPCLDPFGAAVTLWNLDPDALPCVQFPTIVPVIVHAFYGCKLSFSIQFVRQLIK